MTGTLIKYWLCGRAGKVELLRNPKCILRPLLFNCPFLAWDLLSSQASISPLEKNLPTGRKEVHLPPFAFLSFPCYWSNLNKSIRSLYSEEHTILAWVIGTGIGIYHQRQNVKCKKMPSSVSRIWNSNKSTLSANTNTHFTSTAPRSGLHVYIKIFLDFGNPNNIFPCVWKMSMNYQHCAL